jgi:catechol 2,3-dioxygenase-like lactoylglutathione lyase family enzyme
MIPVSFLAASNPNVSISFYQNILGLEFIQNNGFSLIFKLNDHEIRIQLVEKFQPHNFTAFGFKVENIENKIRELMAKGITFEQYDFIQQDELKIWQTEDGAKIAWFKDPDGNILSLSQFP